MTKTQIIHEAASYSQIGSLGNNVAKVAGVGSAAGGVMKLDEIGIFVGIISAISGVIVGWYYKRKEFKLRELYYRTHGVSLEDAE